MIHLRYAPTRAAPRSLMAACSGSTRDGRTAAGSPRCSPTNLRRSYDNQYVSSATVFGCFHAVHAVWSNCCRMSSTCRDVEGLSRMQHDLTVAHVERHLSLHAVQDLVVIVGMCFIEVVGVVAPRVRRQSFVRECLLDVLTCHETSVWQCSAASR